jgi:hypothetical protein
VEFLLFLAALMTLRPKGFACLSFPAGKFIFLNYVSLCLFFFFFLVGLIISTKYCSFKINITEK